MLAVGIVILTVAYFQPPAIMMISYFAATLFASSWGPVAFMSVWSQRITADGAFWGIVVGFVGNLIPKVLSVFEVISLPVYLDPFVIGIVLSFITIVLVSRNGLVTEAEDLYRLKVHQAPPTDYDPSLTARTLWFARGLMVCGAVVTILMIVFYVLPYQHAVGHKADSLCLARWFWS